MREEGDEDELLPDLLGEGVSGLGQAVVWDVLMGCWWAARPGKVHFSFVLFHFLFCIFSIFNFSFQLCFIIQI
jgi:hypothetical protein